MEKFGIEKLVFAAKMLKRDRKDVLEKWFEIMQASEGGKKIGRTVWTDQEGYILLCRLYGNISSEKSIIFHTQEDAKLS